MDNVSNKDSTNNNSSNKQKLIISIIILVFVVLGIGYYIYAKSRVSTDDAYVKSDLGHFASQIKGQVSKVYANNLDYVTSGQVLAIFDQSIYKANLAQTQAYLNTTESALIMQKKAIEVKQAQLIEAKAKLVAAKKENARTILLVPQSYASKNQYDQAVANIKVAKAEVASAQAALAQEEAKYKVIQSANGISEAKYLQAKIDLEHTIIKAPFTGQLQNFTLQPGDTYNPGQQMFVVVRNTPKWVDANFEETQMKNLHVGMNVDVYLDMYPDHLYKGKIVEISPATGSQLSILPPENATGNWVKVTQRIPVKVEIDNENSKYPLRAGVSATVIAHI